MTCLYWKLTINKWDDKNEWLEITDSDREMIAKLIKQGCTEGHS